MRKCLFDCLYELDNLRDLHPAQVIERLKETFDIEIPAGIPPEELESRLQGAQKGIISEHTNLPVVIDSLKGRKSIQEAYLELSRINRGISKYLPRKKDEKHNQRVAELGAVVGYTKVLPFTRNGYLCPDNFIAGYSWSQIAALVPPLILGKTNLPYYLVTSLTSFGMGIFFSRFRKENSSELELCSDGESRAIYVDRKIEDLFRK